MGRGKTLGGAFAAPRGSRAVRGSGLPGTSCRAHGDCLWQLKSSKSCARQPVTVRLGGKSSSTPLSDRMAASEGGVLPRPKITL